MASLIREIIAEAIQSKLSDPRIERFTSITRVELSDDLSLAKVFVSVMADETRRKLTVTALQHAAGRLRSAIGNQVVLRQVPALVFRLDDSIRQSFETVQTIDRLMDELDGAHELVGPSRQDGPAEFELESAEPAASCEDSDNELAGPVGNDREDT